MDSRKEELKKALIEEYNTLPEYDKFGGKNNTIEYGEAIEYLENGKLPKNWEDNALLYAIIEDFDVICSDYGIE